MNQKTLETLQEVFFDLTDLIDSGQVYGIDIDGFQEFKTLVEFLQEQKEKIALLETMITNESEAQNHGTTRNFCLIGGAWRCGANL